MLPRTPHPDPLPTRSVMQGPRKKTAVNGRGEGTELKSGERSLSTLTTQPSINTVTCSPLKELFLCLSIPG